MLSFLSYLELIARRSEVDEMDVDATIKLVKGHTQHRRKNKYHRRSNQSRGNSSEYNKHMGAN